MFFSVNCFVCSLFYSKIILKPKGYLSLYSVRILWSKDKSSSIDIKTTKEESTYSYVIDLKYFIKFGKLFGILL